MFIKLTRNTIASGQHLEAGRVYDIADPDASAILKAGRAVKYTADQSPAEPKVVPGDADGDGIPDETGRPRRSAPRAAKP